MDHIGKTYDLVIQHNYYHLKTTFPSLPLGMRPKKITIHVKSQETPTRYVADITSDAGNLEDKKVYIEESDKGIQVFAHVDGSTLYAPIGYIV